MVCTSVPTQQAPLLLLGPGGDFLRAWPDAVKTNSPIAAHLRASTAARPAIAAWQRLAQSFQQCLHRLGLRSNPPGSLHRPWQFPNRRTPSAKPTGRISKSSGPGETPMPNKRTRRNEEPLLTPRQLDILRFVQEYRDNRGCSPTLQEIASHFRRSKVTVFEHVEALVKAALLRREPNKARSLRLTDTAKKVLPPSPRATAPADRCIRPTLPSPAPRWHHCRRPTRGSLRRPRSSRPRRSLSSQ